MSRPRYETSADLEKEQFFVKAFPEFKFAKVPFTYGYDFFGTLKDRTVVAELKSPNCPLTKMRDGRMILSLHKFQACVDAPVYTAYLFVMALDGVWVTDMNRGVLRDDNGKLMIKMDGRTNRGDPQDWEPCVQFKIENFKLLLNPEQLVVLKDEYQKTNDISAQTLQRIRQAPNRS